MDRKDQDKRELVHKHEEVAHSYEGHEYSHEGTEHTQGAGPR
jgi:hypothetical protein